MFCLHVILGDRDQVIHCGRCLSLEGLSLIKFFYYYSYALCLY